MRLQLKQICILSLATAALGSSAFAKPKNTLRPREEYLQRVQQQQAIVPQVTTPGSLWVNGGRLTDLSTDYKAIHLNDIIVIQVTHQTISEATGDTETQRQLTGSSAITALPGKLNVGGFNPLFGGNSATSQKGTGTTSSSSK